MLYVWEILKQFFQAVLLPYSGLPLLLNNVVLGLQLHPIELFGPTHYQWDLDSFNKKLINEFKLA
jgi:hypothetical protein